MPAPFGTGTSLFKNERLSEEVQLLDLDLSASLGQLLLDVLSLSLGDLLLDSLGSAIDDTLASFRPRPVISFTSLMTCILVAPASAQDDVELGLLFLKRQQQRQQQPGAAAATANTELFA